MIWQFLHPRMTAEYLGLVPSFFNDDDERPAAAQIDAHYAHGGGFRSFGAEKWTLDQSTMTLTFPDDPPLRPLAATQLREEKIYFYDHALLLILQPDGSFAVTRVD